jgi:two-component system sensor histidine kinase ChvG
VLDRLAKTAGADDAHAPAEAEAHTEADGHGEAPPRVRWRGVRRVGGWSRRALQFFTAQSSSSVTRRIVSLNVAGLLALSIGIIYLSQFRAGLIDARIQSLLVQSQIIAGAIAASATVETDSSITINPDTLLNLQPKLRPVRGCALRHRFSDQSRARGADPAPPGFTDQDTRAYLRP